MKTKGLQSSVERRMKIQEEIRKVKQLTRDNLNERKKLREEHRLRRKDNLKKREENQRKAEVVQVVCLKLSGFTLLIYPFIVPTYFIIIALYFSSRKLILISLYATFIL